MSEAQTPVTDQVACGGAEGRPPAGAPRRCNPLASCLLPTLRQLHWATVRDISARGIGLVMDQAFRPDTPVVIQLWTAGPSLVELPARVAEARLDPSGKWLVGCEFETALPAGQLPTLA